VLCIADDQRSVRRSRTIYQVARRVEGELTMARLLKSLALLMGVACALIGLYHLVLGIRSVPGEELAGATVDSRERFYNAIFLGYGLAWIWAARQSPISANLIRFLSAIFLLAAVGRLISIADVGWPHWFQTALTALEIVLPFVFFWLAAADQKANRAPTPVPGRATSPSDQ
jgi:hypothetical protein